MRRSSRRSCSPTAQAILAERGEDYSRRASNPSDYLLSGVVVRGQCQRHYTGTAARGRNNRYRYYTCFTRQRYGTARCNADRLPAGALEDALLDALHHTYKRRDLLAEALAAHRAAADDGRPEREEQLRQVKADIAKSEDSIERYLLAFEAKTLPEASCGDRVRNLAEKVAKLRLRRDDPVEELEATSTAEAIDVDDKTLNATLSQLIQGGDRSTAKALVQQLVPRSGSTAGRPSGRPSECRLSRFALSQTAGGGGAGSFQP